MAENLNSDLYPPQRSYGDRKYSRRKFLIAASVNTAASLAAVGLLAKSLGFGNWNNAHENIVMSDAPFLDMTPEEIESQRKIIRAAGIKREEMFSPNLIEDEIGELVAAERILPDEILDPYGIPAEINYYESGSGQRMWHLHIPMQGKDYNDRQFVHEISFSQAEGDFKFRVTMLGDLYFVEDPSEELWESIGDFENVWMVDVRDNITALKWGFTDEKGRRPQSLEVDFEK